LHLLKTSDTIDSDWIAQLTFIEKLMSARSPDVKPCEAFDLIGGVGIAG